MLTLANLATPLRIGAGGDFLWLAIVFFVVAVIAESPGSAASRGSR